MRSPFLLMQVLAPFSATKIAGKKILLQVLAAQNLSVPSAFVILKRRNFRGQHSL